MKKIEEFKFIDWAKLAGILFLAFFVFLSGCKSCFSVSSGEVGVTFNKINGNTKTYSQGMHLKIPFIESVVDFDVKTMKLDVKANSASKDLQKVHIHVVLNYHLLYDKVNDLYVKVGQDYERKIIVPAINEAVKASTAQFPVEEIIVKREKVKESIEGLLKEKLKVYYIVLESVNLVDINFDPEFNKVVEEKQIEEQKIKTAEYKKRQAQENKKTTILEAEAEARKQQLLSQSASKDVISLKWIEKWDGKLPNYMMGDKSSVLIKMPKE